jgi:hypothetical protein
VQKDKNSELILTIREKELDVVREFLKGGESNTAREDGGKRAIDISMENEFLDGTLALLDHGLQADPVDFPLFPGEAGFSVIKGMLDSPDKKKTAPASTVRELFPPK